MVRRMEQTNQQTQGNKIMNEIETMAETIRSFNDDERRCLDSLMESINLKLIGVPEETKSVEYFVPQRNIRSIMIPLLESIQLLLKVLEPKEIRELDNLIKEDGLRIFKIEHKIEYVEF